MTIRFVCDFTKIQISRNFYFSKISDFVNKQQNNKTES